MGTYQKISNSFKWSESLKRTLEAWRVLEDNIKVHVKTGLNGVGRLHQAEDIIQAQVLEKTVTQKIP